MNDFSTSARRADFDPAVRSSYGFVTRENLRFADVDANGHINNVAFLVFFENARVSYISRQIPSLQRHGLGVVLAHLDIDYRAQLFYPGQVEASARLLEIRRSSLTIAQALFDPTGKCVAAGHAIVVAFDRAANRSQTIPADMRAELQRLMQAPGGSLC